MAEAKSRELYEEARNVVDGIRSGFLHAPWGNSDGGFGRAPRLASDAWSTAEAITLAYRLGIGDEARVDQAVEYLVDVQNRDGGWGARQSISDTHGTALALLALHNRRHESRIANVAESGLAWLASSQNADGGWPLIPATEKQKHSTVSTTVLANQAVLAWFLSNVGDAATTNEVLTLASHMLNSARSNGAWGLTTGAEPTVRHSAYVVLGATDRTSRGSSFDSRW
jgi:squalene cyclase